MTFNLDGLIWLAPAISWGYLALRLGQFYQRTKGKVPQFLFFASLCLVVPFIIGSLHAFFFTDNLLTLKWAIIISVFVLAFSLAFFDYLVFYIKFPKIEAKFAFLVGFILALITLIFYLLFPPNPSLGPGREIKWNLHPWPAIWLFTLVAGTVIPFGIILIQEALSLQPSKERVRGFGLGLMAISGIIIIFFLTIVEVLWLRRFLVSIWAVVIFVLTYFTQKPPPPQYVKKL